MIIKKWLLILRDFSHVFLKRQNKTEETPYYIYMGAVLVPLYIVLAVLVMIPMSKAGVNFKAPMGNPITLALAGIVMFAPMYFIIKWIVAWLKPIPLPSDLPKGKYRLYAFIFVLTFLGGFALMPILF